MRGLLGWSNKRTGLEFYRYDPKVIPRHGSEWGDLLALEMSRDLEGRSVLVVVLDRGTTEKQLEEIEWLIGDALRPKVES